MPFTNYLLAAAAVFGIIQILKIGKGFPSFICGLQVLAICLILVALPSLQSFSFYLLMAASILAVIYPLQRDFLRSGRSMILLVLAMPVLAAYVLKAFHLQGISVLNYFMIISLLAFVLVLRDIPKFRRELGYSSILAVEALVRFSNQIF